MGAGRLGDEGLAVPAPQHVLVINSGSSSVKLAVVDPASGHRSLTALAEEVGSDAAVVSVRRGDADETGPPTERTHRGIVAHVLSGFSGEERSRPMRAAIIGVFALRIFSRNCGSLNFCA